MKPLADHGTTARAKGRPDAGIKGCPCLPCREAERRYSKRRRYLNATGRTVMVDVEPAAAHLDALFDAGAGWVQLAAATGCSNSSLSVIRRRVPPQIRRITANKILAVQPGDARPPRRPIDATGARRRIQALMAIGHSLRAISAAAEGLHTCIIRKILGGQLGVVTTHTADRVAAAYRKLAATPGDNQRARNRAQHFGWPGPLAWGDIDDPNAEPEVETAPVQESRKDVADVRADEIQHLGRFGISDYEIARRVGVTPGYVRSQLTGSRAPGWRDKQKEAA